MIKNILLCLFLLSGISSSYSQVENIPSGNPVYHFLKLMQVRNIIPHYDDFVLPISKGQVTGLLLQIEDRANELTDAEAALLNKYLDKFGVYESPLSIISDITGTLKSDSPKNFLFYEDSTIHFTLNPLVGFRTIAVIEQHSDESHFAYLGKLGGNFYGSYDNWLGFFLQSSNEAVWGSREAASRDKDVAQSFTFNDTKINFIDQTQGYLRLENKHVSLQLGRERILWGSGYEERMILSDNPPVFDFVRLNFDYKSFNYKFIHGWLVQKPNLIKVDTFLTIKNKPSKYIAVSRLGFNPSDNIKLGLSQFVIYSNRPFEAAYLNPLLFWESAQRSLNDLDNSFLSLDLRILISSGLEINSSILLDDIDFGRLIDQGWSDISNRNAWNIGLYAASPFLFSDFSLTIDYAQVRPYMFSHPGEGEMLTYTNNGYLLGIPSQPNSSNFKIKVAYQFTANATFDLGFNYNLHGENVRDPEGELIRNVGGNLYDFYTYYNEGKINLLEGMLSRNHAIVFNLALEPIYYFFINANYTRLAGKVREDFFQLSFNYAPF